MCVCDWVTLLYSRKLTEHCKPTIKEKIKKSLQKETRWQATYQEEKKGTISVTLLEDIDLVF